MSRRVEDLEHRCRDCDTWTEVWDDGEPGQVWISCECGGGYAARATVVRLAAEWAREGTP